MPLSTPTLNRTRPLPRVLRLCAVIGLMGMLLVAPPATLAHAELVSAAPLPNASLVTPPERMRITFSEPIDPAASRVQLLDAQLRPVEGLGPTSVDRDGVVATVDLPALEAGIYTVAYEVVSTVDGHATSGRFAFVVDPTGARAPPTSLPTSTTPAVDAWAVLARWLALAAALVGFGTLVMWWHAGRETIAGLAPGADPRPPWRLVTVSAAGTLAGLALYLWLSARPIGGVGLTLDPAAAFGWTPFATAMRVAMLAALGAALAGAVATIRRVPSAWPVGVVGGLLAISMGGMSAAGHASSLGGPVNVALDWAHLVAAAAWLGGLPAVLPLAARVAAAGGSRRDATLELLRRHGGVALAAGPLVILTGLANSPLVLGRARELVASPYGNLLLLKAALVSVALGIGAANHFLLRRRSGGRGAVAALVGVEVAVAAIVVLAAATLVTIQPGAARQPVLTGPSVQPAHFFGEAGPSYVHASVSVPAPGRQTYQVVVRDAASGVPRPDVQKVFLAFTPPAESGLAAERVELEAGEIGGLYATAGARTPVVGEWTVEVIVRRAGERDEPVAFGMRVDEPSPPRIGPPPDTGVGVPAPLAVLWSVLPAGPAGWLPAIAAIGAVIGLGFRRAPSPALRFGLLAMAAILVMAAGSRSVVEAANRPTATELAEFGQPIDGSVMTGERIYLANCASCHGTDGAGGGPAEPMPAPRPLAEALAAMSDAEVSYRIANGLAGTPMPAFAASLTEQERRDLVAYLRQRWGAP